MLVKLVMTALQEEELRKMLNARARRKKKPGEIAQVVVTIREVLLQTGWESISGS